MYHGKELSNKIRDYLQQISYKTEWRQFRSCNAYIGNDKDIIIDKTNFNVIPFRSYDTVVGYIDTETCVLYEVGKYSQTTSKQVTQYYNTLTNVNERIFHSRIW